jgi:hypothetical protein
VLAQPEVKFTSKYIKSVKRGKDGIEDFADAVRQALGLQDFVKQKSRSFSNLDGGDSYDSHGSHGSHRRSR